MKALTTEKNQILTEKTEILKESTFEILLSEIMSKDFSNSSDYILKLQDILVNKAQEKLEATQSVISIISDNPPLDETDVAKVEELTESSEVYSTFLQWSENINAKFFTDLEMELKSYDMKDAVSTPETEADNKVLNSELVKTIQTDDIVDTIENAKEIMDAKENPNQDGGDR